MLSTEAETQTRGFDNSWYHAKTEFNYCFIIIHQTRYEKSDWSRVFNQFSIACELDMITAISAADIAFIMSSSMSTWLLLPLECSAQKQNGWTLRFCFWGWIMWKMYNKTIIEFGFRMISWIIKTSCLCYRDPLNCRPCWQYQLPTVLSREGLCLEQLFLCSFTNTLSAKAAII